MDPAGCIYRTIYTVIIIIKRIAVDAQKWKEGLVGRERGNSEIGEQDRVADGG